MGDELERLCGEEMGCVSVGTVTAGCQVPGDRRRSGSTPAGFKADTEPVLSCQPQHPNVPQWAQQQPDSVCTQDK